MSKPNGPWFRVPKATASVALDHGGSNMLLLLVALLLGACPVQHEHPTPDQLCGGGARFG